MKDTKETIEFFTPALGLAVEPYIAAGQKQGIHHLGRYHWSVRVLEGRKPKTLLDIACGAGYGSYIIAMALPDTQVVGADYDERAVAYATSHYKAPNLAFVRGDMVRWLTDQQPLGRFDAVTSFDTIEHLLHREIAMQQVVDNLDPEGCLLLSTPCGHSDTRLNPGWEHHKIEFSYKDLFAFLKRFFEKVIHPEDQDFVGLNYWQEVINRDQRRYLNRMNPLICTGPIRSAVPRNVKT